MDEQYNPEDLEGNEPSDEDEEIVVLTDDEGKETPFVVLDRLTVRGVDYAVLCEPDDEDSVLIFREEPGEDGDTLFLPTESEDEEQEVFDYFRISFEDYEFGDAL